MTRTVSIRYVVKVLETAKDAGLDPAALAHAVGLDPSLSAALDARVPSERFHDLFALAAERSADPAFPLRVAEAMDPSSLHVLGFVCMASPTFGEALQRLVRFLGILTNSARWETRIEGDAVLLALARDPPRRPEQQWADEFALAQMVAGARRLTGVNWTPREVRYAHAGGRDMRAQRAFFGCEITYGNERNEILFDRTLLALPMLDADPELLAFFDRYLTSRLEPSDGGPLFLSNVKRQIAEGLPDRVPTIEALSRRLGVSERTLRRRLKEQGTNFTAVVDDVRGALAKQHLDAGALAVGEIAFLLGFSEPAPFHRAFRRWTGMTPQQYRKRHLGT